jgi:hypothetical protein
MSLDMRWSGGAAEALMVRSQCRKDAAGDGDRPAAAHEHTSAHQGLGVVLRGGWTSF